MVTPQAYTKLRRLQFNGQSLAQTAQYKASKDTLSDDDILYSVH